MWNLPEHVRAWVYRVGTVVVPLLVLYGVTSEHEAALWLGVLAAVLSVGEGALASVNTSAVKPRDDGHGGEL